MQMVANLKENVKIIVNKMKDNVCELTLVGGTLYDSKTLELYIHSPHFKTFHSK